MIKPDDPICGASAPAEAKTMDEWRVDFKAQNFVDLYKQYGLDKCFASIADWIASHREKILLAWWAEHGFAPGAAVCIEDRLDGGEVRWYVQESTAEERERIKAIRQHTQPTILAQVADEWFAKNDNTTIRQAFMAGARWAQEQ